MKYKRYATACFLAIFSVITFLGISTTNAQATPSTSPGNSLRITPAITQVELRPGENTLTLEYTVSNLTNQPLAISLGARDFGAFSQSGSITLYGSGYNPATNAHGIQSYVTFPSSKVIVPANTSQRVDVTVQNTEKLAPGGHYGAILFNPQSVFSATNNNHIDLNTSIAGLVFLTTAYGGTYGMSASMSHMDPIQFKLPNNTYLVFNNTGNTQTTPQGQLTLYGPHSKVLGTQVVNSSSGLILSGGSRIFQVQLPLQAKWYTLPGIYHLKLQYKDSEDSSFKTLNQTFLYINWKITLLFIAVIVLIIYIINKFIWKLLKRLIYFRIRRRKVKSAATTDPIVSGPKVMDISRPKHPKNPR